MKKLRLFSLAFIWFTVCLTSTVNAQGVGINASGNPPDPSAILDASSTTKGTLITRMTTAQRDAISSPAEGLQIFNITTKCFEFYANGRWQALGCACTVPTSVVALATPNPICPGATLTLTGSATGATTWSWTGPNGFTSTLRSPTIPNITTAAAGVYTLTVSNSCGAATAVNTFSVTVAWSCGCNLTVTHTIGTVAPETKTVTYGTVMTNLSNANKCWTTQNLGASNQAGSATDATDAAAGWYWQFNRKQGYKVGPTPAWTITAISENSDWLAANDPCTILLGTGWRIPIYDEWTNANANAPFTNYTGAFNSVLRLHAGGFLNGSNGALTNRGSTGEYWSASQHDVTTGWDLNFNSSSSIMSGPNKSDGYPLRCIKD